MPIKNSTTQTQIKLTFPLTMIIVFMMRMIMSHLLQAMRKIEMLKIKESKQFLNLSDVISKRKIKCVEKNSFYKIKALILEQSIKAHMLNYQADRYMKIMKQRFKTNRKQRNRKLINRKQKSKLIKLSANHRKRNCSKKLHLIKEAMISFKDSQKAIPKEK